MNLPSPIARLDSRKLQPGYRHANAAICQHDGRLLCAYRYQQPDGSLQVGICRLNKKLQPMDDRRVDLAEPAGSWIEDPRLCVAGGRLILLVAQINHGSETPIASAGNFTLAISPPTTGPGGFFVRAFVLDDETLQPERELPLPFGHNGRGRNEKNWMPFELPGGSLGLVYGLRPHAVIEQATGTIHTTPGIARWRWGTLSGRTNAILLDADRYLALIGGHVAHSSRNSRYWVGAYTFSATTPHHILGVSHEPLLWADEHAPALLNLGCPSWNPVCLFPAGLVREDDESLLVSAGTNDSFVDFLRFDLARVLAGLVAPELLTGEERIIAAEEKPPAGLIRVRVVSNRPLGEFGGPYFKGDEFNLSPDRVAALGPKKVLVLA